jgi:membrane protein YdbS with pleckstrin-like domain
MDKEHVAARMQGAEMAGEHQSSRSPLDWLLVAVASGVFIYFATLAHAPSLPFHGLVAVLLSLAILVLLVISGWMLWRTTRFN